ncbi:MAG: D-alanine--D-alanine ligase [Zetaproteobacteria bacterium]|nr:D-alanine--D-alanine ligase [Zetaproteobacteria bacterium]
MATRKDTVRVGLVYGGNSAEHSVSVSSASFIGRALEDAGFYVTPIFVTVEGEWVWLRDPEADMDKQPRLCGVPGLGLVLATNPQDRLALDVVFDIVHGYGGEDGAYQGYFKVLGLPVVGTDIIGSALCMDKVATKQIWHGEGRFSARYLAGPAAQLLAMNSGEIFEHLGSPVFVKPVNTGSSVGVCKAHDSVSLQGALQEAAQYDLQVIVEEQICGREIEVAVWQESMDGPLQASVAAEIIPQKDFYSYQAKYQNADDAKLELPANLSSELLVQLQDLAREAFRLLKCRGFARVDFFVVDDICYLNEINTLPGFTSISMFPRLVEYSGRPVHTVLAALVQEALERGEVVKKISSAHAELKKKSDSDEVKNNAEKGFPSSRS